MPALELSSYPWQSSSVYAARLDPDGQVLQANAALVERAGDDLIGTPFAALFSTEQRLSFGVWFSGLDRNWSTAMFGLQDPARGQAEDRRLWARRAEDDQIELFAEPAWQDQSLLVRQVLQLNDDLISTQRSLSRRQRQLEEAQAEAHGATLRVSELESVLLASLAHTDSNLALQELLTTAQDLLPGERADLLLVDETLESLTLRASAGTTNLIDPRPLIKLGDGILGTLAATGESVLVEDLSKTSTRDGARGSLIAAALRVDERIAGVLAVRAEEPHSFERTHLRLLEVVSDRIALAVGHTQLREREHRMAEVLQRTLLPQRLPELPGMQLSAHYESRGASVGGDFYDAIVLPDGRLALTIGDVMGKGLRAAAAMAHLRAGVHALAIDSADPGDVLLRLGRMAEADNHFATAVLLLIDLTDGTVAFANAGHPPPLLVQPGNAVFLEPKEGHSPLLGFDVAHRGAAQLHLPEGATLVLYTDGLVESTRDLDAGLALLQQEALAHADAPPETLCDHLLSTLSPTGRYRDDVTLLAIRREPRADA